MDKILKREDKLAFMALSGDNSSFSRMRGFTEFSVSKNPIEYSRRYIDEKTERNDVVAYSPSISYSFDKFSGDSVHSELVAIADNETVGGDAIKKIVIVDMTGTGNSKTAYCRNWSVIPDGEGDDPDAYTYSGTLKANGGITKGTAASTDDWQTCTFTADE